jgi:hypothetical protein
MTPVSAASSLLTILEQMANIASILRVANETLQPPGLPAPQMHLQAVLVDVDDVADELVLMMPNGDEWRCDSAHARYAAEALDLYIGNLPSYYSEKAFDLLRKAVGENWEKRTVYATLGLDPNARQEVVDAAYKALARCLHPDREGGSETAMMKLNAAYAAIRKERGWTK